MEGKYPQLAVELTAGNHLSIRFYLNGNVANLVGRNENVAAIELQQAFYARCIGEELMLSSNSIEWNPFFCL